MSCHILHCIHITQYISNFAFCNGSNPCSQFFNFIWWDLCIAGLRRFCGFFIIWFYSFFNYFTSPFVNVNLFRPCFALREPYATKHDTARYEQKIIQRNIQNIWLSNKMQLLSATFLHCTSCNSILNKVFC